MHKFIQTILLLLCFAFSINTQAQTINIPDAIFKEILLLANTDNSIAKDSLNNDIKIDINNNSEIEISEALRVFSLDVSPSIITSFSIITSLEGIASFTNLQYLSCYDNQLSSLNVSGLTNLQSLNCGINQLNSLDVSGLTNLQSLDCFYNQLNSLNVSGLTNLVSLDCRRNQLSSLDVSGLTNLLALSCWNNQLNSLNVSSLNNLVNLDCAGNQLNSLEVSNLSNLISLECSENPLGSIDVSSLTSLEILGCSNNQLSSLNVSGLTNLQDLKCIINQLSSLNVSSLTNLVTLYCGNNQLSSLYVGGLTNLEYLHCAGNQLSSLNVSGLSNLVSLDCRINQLSSLNLSGLTNLEYFYCGINPLNSIYMKDGIDNFYDVEDCYLSPNPNLRYICADGIEVSSLQNRLISQGIYNCTVNPFCSISADGTHYTLNGNAKYDANSNGCTSSDSNFPYLQIKIKNAIDSGYAFSDSEGNFVMTLDSGAYTLTPQMPNSYFSCTPTSTTVTFPEDSIPQQFCITPNGIHHDVEISIVPVRAARPGFSDATYKIILKNKGNQIENGTILFSYDEDKQDYISATITPTTVVSDSLTFAFSNLQLFETRIITVTMRTNAPTDNPAVNAGDVLVLSENANINSDENLDDNTQQIQQTVVGSFDPNDKTCLEGDIITPNIVGDFVNYLIRFENTGTANAENIVVTDFIDLNTFDISTLELTSTSHDCKTLISNENKVQFVFDNIQLPFTEPLKHGYVAFKIKLKNNLVIGDSLKNHADIYFDYNLPITTNTATSRIENITTIKTNSKKDGSLSVYPNPGNGNFIVNFESKENNPITIKVTDLNGKTVYEQKMTHHERSTTPIELQNLPNGMYQLQISSNKDVWIQKLLIVR